MLELADEPRIINVLKSRKPSELGSAPFEVPREHLDILSLLPVGTSVPIHAEDCSNGLTQPD